ncbi:MAG: UxaA family hydrolase [bacterium]
MKCLESMEVGKEEAMPANAVLIDSRDNVAVAIRELEPGDALTGVAGVEVSVQNSVPRNHKVSIKEIPEGTPIIKYGEQIGRAGETIPAGEWVHTHNLTSGEE